MQRQPSTVRQKLLLDKGRKRMMLGKTNSQPLGIIDLAGAEQGIQRVISWNDEASKVRQQPASDVEKDEEEVHADQSKESVHLGHRGLLLEVVEGRILRQLD